MAIITPGPKAYGDAGNTSLSERILFATGVISAAGSVNRSSTGTGTCEVERPSGIGISSPVVASRLNQLRTVQRIDSPGQADRSEVAGLPGMLAGVPLLVPSVMGGQLHTRCFTQAVRASGLPLLLFIHNVGQPVAGATLRRCP